MSLSPTEYNLLRYLLVNKGRVVSKAQILDHVWDYDFGGDGGVVETYIGYLRRKLDTTDAPPDPDDPRRGLHAAGAASRRPMSLRARLLLGAALIALGARASRPSPSSRATRAHLVDQVDAQLQQRRTSRSASSARRARQTARNDDGAPPPERALRRGPDGRRRARDRPAADQPRDDAPRPRSTTATSMRSRAGSIDHRRERATRTSTTACGSGVELRDGRDHRARAPARRRRRGGAAPGRRRGGRGARGAGRARPRDVVGDPPRRAPGAADDRDGRRHRGGRPVASASPEGTPGHRGRRPRRGAQRDARPHRGGLRPAHRVRGPPAPVRRRRLARAAHPGRHHPRVRRALPRRRPRRAPAELDDAMRRTEQEAVRMGTLVDDLLHLARLDQGRPLERAPVDLGRSCEDAVQRRPGGRAGSRPSTR